MWHGGLRDLRDAPAARAPRRVSGGFSAAEQRARHKTGRPPETARNAGPGHWFGSEPVAPDSVRPYALLC